MRVLVVEDDAAVRQFICTALERRDYHVMAASNGSEALEIAATFASDLVITDFTMPGMNGSELVALLRERRYPAAYLLISGTYEEAQPDADLPFLPKPFTATQLLQAVDKTIELRSFQNSAPLG